jgi:geranylgeranyl pyrophosphate synthase
LHTAYTAERAWVDAALEETLQQQWEYLKPDELLAQPLQALWAALRHATVLGGKRVRPLLALEAFRAIAGPRAPWEGVQHFAVALELIHAQSLVFDDLPCMDNDDWRRGQPTVHKAFGEATAVLVGDALACLAFEVLAQTSATVPPAAVLRCVQLLGRAASLGGLVTGQFADMQALNLPPTRASVLLIHTHKTAALLQCALVGGATLAGASVGVVQAFSHLGLQFGLLFQAIDDTLDATATSEQLGKTAGKDAEQAKLSLYHLEGPLAAAEAIEALSLQAQQALEALAQAVGPTFDTAPWQGWLSYLQQRQT